MENLQQDEWVDITIGELHDSVKNVANWKAPGMDQVQKFWLKSLKILHPTLTICCNEDIRNPLQHLTGLLEGARNSSKKR